MLAFDITYRTNAYKKSLVVLVGFNHHHQTLVFGFMPLMDESIGTYSGVGDISYNNDEQEAHF